MSFSKILDEYISRPLWGKYFLLKVFLKRRKVNWVNAFLSRIEWYFSVCSRQCESTQRRLSSRAERQTLNDARLWQNFAFRPAVSTVQQCFRCEHGKYSASASPGIKQNSLSSRTTTERRGPSDIPLPLPLLLPAYEHWLHSSREGARHGRARVRDW